MSLPWFKRSPKHAIMDATDLVFLQRFMLPSTAPTSSAAQLGSDESLKALVEEHLTNKTEVSFFCLSGVQDHNGKFSFRTTKSTLLAEGIGTNAEELNGNHALHKLQVADTVAFDKTGTLTVGQPRLVLAMGVFRKVPLYSFITDALGTTNSSQVCLPSFPPPPFSSPLSPKLQT